jgi:hypothetical protein
VSGVIRIAGMAAILAVALASLASFSENFDSYVSERWPEGTTHGAWYVDYDSNPCGRVGIVGTTDKMYKADLSQCTALRATKTSTVATYPTDVTFEVDFRVVKKTLSTTRGWHTAWIGWAHTGDNQWNNLILKSGGWEIGKFSPECPDGGSNRNQCYFKTGTTPKFADGLWHTARIEQRAIEGGVEITAYGDGVRLATVSDTQNAPNTSGNILLYNEGSVVRFGAVRVY